MSESSSTDGNPSSVVFSEEDGEVSNQEEVDANPRALVHLDRVYQDKLAAASDTFTSRINELTTELRSCRELAAVDEMEISLKNEVMQQYLGEIDALKKTVSDAERELAVKDKALGALQQEHDLMHRFYESYRKQSFNKGGSIQVQVSRWEKEDFPQARVVLFKRKYSRWGSAPRTVTLQKRAKVPCEH